MNDIAPLLQTIINLPLLALVLARMSGLVIFAPFFSSASIPVKARGFLATGLTIIVLPFATQNLIIPGNLSTLLTAIVGELLIGMAVGLMTSTLFVGLELSGSMIAQQMGLSAAQVFDPLSNANTSALSQLYYWMAIIVFLIIRGHIVLIGALAKSFQTLPIGQFMVTEDLIVTLTSVLQMAFVLAFHIFAPLLAAIFLTTLALGFVGRTVPQLNILSIGFPIRIAFGLIVLLVCVTPAAHIFLCKLDETFLKIYQFLHF